MFFILIVKCMSVPPKGKFSRKLFFPDGNHFHTNYYGLLVLLVFAWCPFQNLYGIMNVVEFLLFRYDFEAFIVGFV